MDSRISTSAAPRMRLSSAVERVETCPRLTEKWQVRRGEPTKSPISKLMFARVPYIPEADIRFRPVERLKVGWEADINSYDIQLQLHTENGRTPIHENRCREADRFSLLKANSAFSDLVYTVCLSRVVATDDQSR